MKDIFSVQSAHYARYRPVYPQELYDFLLENTPGRRSAWDVGTGNGQVAAVLAQYFDQVHATDISASQLELAPALPNVQYALEPAGHCSLPDHSCDLVTAAQAAHWFNLPEFYAEVLRVLRPGGLLALWGYGLLRTPNPEINRLILKFYKVTTGPYWDKERCHIDEAYGDLLFPFEAMPVPELQIQVAWQPEHLQGFLQSWSAVQHFIREKGYNPVPGLLQQALTVWPEPELEFEFPVFMRAATPEGGLQSVPWTTEFIPSPGQRNLFRPPGRKKIIALPELSPQLQMLYQLIKQPDLIRRKTTLLWLPQRLRPSKLQSKGAGAFLNGNCTRTSTPCTTLPFD